MEQERAQELQRNITGEALALLTLGCGEDGVAKYEQAVQLIGAACNIPKNATNRLLSLIAQGKTDPANIQFKEIAPDGVAKSQENPMINWSASDTFWVMMDLFEVSTCMATFEERIAMYSLAQELIQTQNFTNWLDQAEQPTQADNSPPKHHTCGQRSRPSGAAPPVANGSRSRQGTAPLFCPRHRLWAAVWPLS